MLKGLETLSVRVQRQTETAAKVADTLADHPKVTRAIYPGRPDHPQAAVVQKQMRGGSTLVAFEVAGGKDGAFRFQDALKLVRISNNLGDAKSLITHPATTTHQRLTPQQRAELGISDGMVRLSCGLEHPDDLIEDRAESAGGGLSDQRGAASAGGGSRGRRLDARRSRPPAAWRRSHSPSRSCAGRPAR